MSEKPKGLAELQEAHDDLLRQLEEAGIEKQDTIRQSVKRLEKHLGSWPTRNLAVEICDHMFADATKEALNNKKSQKEALCQGKIAFCSVLPKLSGAANIRDFIACVTHGMAMEIIPGNDAARLLYAAQVAHTALTKRPNKRGKSSQISSAVPEPTPAGSTT